MWNVRSKKLSGETQFEWSSVDQFSLLKSTGRIILGGIGSNGGMRLGTFPGNPGFLRGGRWDDSCVLTAHEGVNKIAVGYPHSSPELLCLMDLGTGNWQTVFRAQNEEGGKSGVSAISFSGDGKSLVLGMESGRVQVVDTVTLKRSQVALAKARISEILPAPSKNGQFLVALEKRETGVSVYDPRTGEVFGLGDTALWRLDLQKGDLSPIGTFSGPIVSLAQSPDGERLAWSSLGMVILYQPSSDQQEALPRPKASKEVTCLAFSQDGAMLATGDREGRIVLWSLADLTATELK